MAIKELNIAIRGADPAMLAMLTQHDVEEYGVVLCDVADADILVALDQPVAINSALPIVYIGKAPSDVLYHLELPLKIHHLWERLIALAQPREVAHAQIDLGNCQLWPQQHRLIGDEVNVLLTDIEVKILMLLHKMAPAAVTREQLLKEVWGYDEAIETHTVETHLYRLRQKVGGALIATDALGYRLAEVRDE